MVLISVVITTYNRVENLISAINSVLNQTFKDLEIIVVDGANSKANKLAVDKYKDDRIRYVSVEPSAVNMYSQFGMQHSRNVGCKIATGKYIAMLDDDDIWLPEKLEKQIKVFEGSSDKVALVICYNKNIEKNGYYVETPKLSPTYKDLLRSFNLSPTSTFLIRKDILEKVGWWNEELRGMHEYDIALKITKLGYEIITVQEILMVRYRYSSQNRRYYYIKIAEVLDFWKYYGKDFLPNLGILKFICNVAKTLALFSIFLSGFIVKEKIWKIIYPLKTLYEQGGNKI